VTDSVNSGHSMSHALVTGYHAGLLLAAAVAIVNLVLSPVSSQIEPCPEELLEGSAAA